MRRFAQLIVVMFLTVACTAAPAAAAELPQDMLNIARVHWPDSLCTGAEQVSFASQDALNRYRSANMPNAHVLGFAFHRSCRILLREDLYTSEDFATSEGRRLACYVLVHELGHIAGHGHEDGLMSANIDDAINARASLPCEMYARPLTLGEARINARAQMEVEMITPRRTECRWVTYGQLVSCRGWWIERRSRRGRSRKVRASVTVQVQWAPHGMWQVTASSDITFRPV